MNARKANRGNERRNQREKHVLEKDAYRSVPAQDPADPEQIVNRAETHSARDRP